jgi:hypothetical protein
MQAYLFVLMTLNILRKFYGGTAKEGLYMGPTGFAFARR